MEVFARVVAQQGREAVVRGTAPGSLISVEEQTAGFTTVHLRGYWSVNRNLHLISGIDNVFDRGYVEHLSLRLPAAVGFGSAGVFSPGFSPYFSMQWTY
jgi:outer membrane receptor protein involved in Fe transport